MYIMPKKQRAGAEKDDVNSQNENSQNENSQKDDSQTDETPVSETPSAIDELSKTPEKEVGTTSSEFAQGLGSESEEINALIENIEEAVSKLKDRLSKKGGKSKKNRNNKKQRKTRKQRRH